MCRDTRGPGSFHSPPEDGSGAPAALIEPTAVGW